MRPREGGYKSQPIAVCDLNDETGVVLGDLKYYLRAVEDVKSHLHYQGELLGIWDPQNRDPRRKPPPETKFSVG